MSDAVKIDDSRLAHFHAMRNDVWEAMWLLVAFSMVDSLYNHKVCSRDGTGTADN